MYKLQTVADEAADMEVLVADLHCLIFAEATARRTRDLTCACTYIKKSKHYR